MFYVKNKVENLHKGRNLMLYVKNEVENLHKS